LTAIFLLSASVANSNFIMPLLKTLLACGLISIFYGIVQSWGLDPFDWVNPYSPVFGLFGNPNFLSAFMGISATVAFTFSISGIQHKLKLFNLIYVILSIYVIYKSNSQQGYLVFLAGTSTVLYLRIKSRTKLRKFSKIYLLFWFLGTSIVTLDIFNKVPWTSILYKESVSFRGDFWRAAYQMTRDNALFGVGFDGYSDNYRRYRDLVAVSRSDIETPIDSAHNVFLDMSSSGGLLMILLYLVLIFFVIRSALNVIRRSENFNVGFAATFGAWTAYMSQSLISINNITLAFWGWIISGVIIGYDVNFGNSTNEIKVRRNNRLSLSISIGLISGAVIAFPLYLADTRFRSEVAKGNVEGITSVAYQWPKSATRMNYVSQVLRTGGFELEALKVAKDALRVNDSNYEVLKEIYLNQKASEFERNQVLEKMKILDPLNPNLK
jgi:O-antigen ligase